MGCGASSGSREVSRPVAPFRFDDGQMGNFRRTIPLTAVDKFNHGAPITKNQIAFQREEYWSTRIGGNIIMWQAIKTASEAMIQNDSALANAIIEASGISTPTGSLETCYDETGYLYKIPRFCYSDPFELIEGNQVVELTAAVEISKKDKGTGSPVKLKVRVNPGDINMQINVSSLDTILDVKRAVQEYSITAQTKDASIPFCDETRQRIMFMGKELKNNNLVSQAGMEDGRVVQVFLRPAAASTKPSTAS